jgi:tripartite-type tricarboxylate transporter receptor subunit TctC
VLRFETNYWIGLGAPKSTPAEIIGKLNREINMALADPGLRSRFTDLGGSVVGGSPDDFAKLVSDETDKWGRVVRAAHIKAE